VVKKMKRYGRVIETDGINAKILLKRHAACGECGACQAGKENMEIQVIAINDANAKVGDMVEIDMATPNVLNAAFLAYGIPFIALVLGIYISSKFVEELFAMVIGFLSLGISYIFIKLYEKKIKGSDKYTSHITKIIN